MSRLLARTLPVLLVGLLLATVGIDHLDAGAAAQSWTLSPADEATYVSNINGIRAANGLGPLVVDSNMTGAARNWTIWMVENETLAHADDIVTGAPSDWLKVGENVGRGGSLDAVWQAVLNSPSHAANVLDPTYDLVGIGVAWNADGRLYTTHRFAATESAEAGGASPPEQPPEPEPTPEPEPSPEPPIPATESIPPDEPADAVPDQLPFEDVPRTSPPAEPARLAATMTLLLAAG